MKPLVSLCMPTNGVIEWVFPVLESIYSQDVSEELFEVVITDNGDNKDFKRRIQSYKKKHSNMIYVETEALPFLNEIESYKRANGELIKFVNHRTKLVKGTLGKLLDFVERFRISKPIVYFSNGVLQLEKRQYTFDNFDKLVKNLSYFSSWSTGMTIWKDDFDKLPEDISGFNELFPHTDVLFHERNREKYIIDNSVIFDEIPQRKKPKGHYDLFYAFGVEYPWIICTLLRDKDITVDTFRYIVNQNLHFIAGFYYDNCLRKRYCSYDLSGLRNIYGVFYLKSELYVETVKVVWERLQRKFRKKGNFK